MGSRSLQNAKNAIDDIAVNDSNKEQCIEPVQIDFEDDDSIQDAFELIKQKYGRLDVLVNNAGMSNVTMTHFGKRYVC